MKQLSIILITILAIGILSGPALSEHLKHGAVICESPGFSGCLDEQSLDCTSWRDYIKEQFNFPIRIVEIERLELHPKSEFEGANSFKMFIYFSYIPE